jgi:hypothetical protein
MFWIMVLVALGASALAAPVWVPVHQQDLWLLAALGLSGFGGQSAITEAFVTDRPRRWHPLNHTALAWGWALTGWWDTLPDNLRCWVERHRQGCGCCGTVPSHRYNASLTILLQLPSAAQWSMRIHPLTFTE